MNLWILRHARAEAASRSGRDFDRVLSAAGRDACGHLNRWLASTTLGLPPRILVSPAARTVETARLVLKGLATPRVERTDELWLASAGELVTLVNASACGGGIMLIGHNPGLEDLIEYLGGQMPVPGLKPATLVVLEVNQPLQPGQATTLQVVPPKDSI